MTSLTSADFPGLFAQRAAALPGGGKVLQKRRAAFESFVSKGLPTSKDEDWKYTNLSALATSAFELATPAANPTLEMLGAHGKMAGVQRLVFVNGHYAGPLSLIGSHEGVTLKNLANELDRGHIPWDPTPAPRSLSALNAALTQDGAVISIDSGTVLDEPIHLIFASVPGARPWMAHPRSYVKVGAHAQATVWVSHVGWGENERSFQNGVMEVSLEEGAWLDLLTLQDASRQSFNLDWVTATLSKDSRFRSHVVAVGGALGRHEVEVAFKGQGGECELEGLFVGRDRQHLDHRTYVDHAVGRCSSRQLYKGVMGDSSHGVFNGKLRVAVDAQKTVALQTNKNLLLSENAQVDTRPQLEIFADDVKCTHGAAVGQLDETALFYLRSRGIPLQQATSVLTYAFASELVDSIKWPQWRALVHDRLATQLPGLDEGGAR